MSSNDTHQPRQEPQASDLDSDQLDQVAGGLSASPITKPKPPGTGSDPCDGGQLKAH